MRASVTPEAFHVLGVGAEVVRGILVNADDADAAGDVEAAFAGRPPPQVLFQGLADDLGGADASFPGFGFQLLLERPLDPDIDPFHNSSASDPVSDRLP